MEQETESFFDSYLNPAYLWFIFILGVISVLNWDTLLRYYDSFWDKWEERKTDARHHKDDAWSEERFAAIEASRLRMQQQLESKSEEYRIKLKEKERQKLEAKIAKYGTDGGRKLGDPSSSKSEYNPLSGDTGGRYKPPKRSKCPGGGCG